MALLATVHDLQFVFKWYTSLLTCSVEAPRTELQHVGLLTDAYEKTGVDIACCS